MRDAAGGYVEVGVVDKEVEGWCGEKFVVHSN